MRILVDQREQCPFFFEGYDVEVVPGTLQAGDYSIPGLESLVAVERKSLPDLVACLGNERDRFKRELERLRGYESVVVVVEAPERDLWAGNYRSKLNAKAAYQSIISFECRYRIPFKFFENRSYAEKYAFSFLRHYLSMVERRYKAVVG